MAARCVVAALAVLLSTVLSHHVPGHWGHVQLHVPPDSKPSFQRGAVERPPPGVVRVHGGQSHSEWLPLREAVELVPENYETQRQPLRDAVEATSTRSEAVKKQPLRDSVEHRVPPSFGGFDESFWLERITPPAIREIQEPAKVVCHLDVEAFYREEPFSLSVKSVPTHKCSHLVIGFKERSTATIDPETFTVVPRRNVIARARSTSGESIAAELRRRDPALRVLMSLASPNEPGILVMPDERLPEFVETLQTLMDENDVDGVEIDWQGASVSFLKRILKYVRENIQDKLVFAALTPDQIADVELADYVDLLVLKAWHPTRSPELVQTPAPLELGTKFVEELTSRGVPPNKIILGIPLFGWSYKLLDWDDGESVLADGYGLDGKYTKSEGQLGYFEICEKIEIPWLYKRHEKNGSYLVLGDQWIGYDDPLTVKIKSAYVKAANLGGVSLYSIDLDDFQGICGDSWPMLNAATSTLGILDGPSESCNKTGLYSDPDNCSGFLSCFDGKLYRGNCGIGRFYDPAQGRCVRARPEICDPGHSDEYSYQTSRLDKLRELQQVDKLEFKEIGPRVVCYVTSWSMYRKGEGKFVPEHLDSRLCTDIVYAFAGLNPETLTMRTFDPWADIDNNLYQRVTSIKGSRVLLALGGWTDSSDDKYSRLVSSQASRRKFASSTVQFLHKYNFKGLSLEWNYPGCWQSDCRRGPDTDKPNFTKLLAELRREFDKQEPKLSLAVALSGYKEVIDKGYDVAEISRLVDFMTVMSYDYHGAWESQTSHLAPLFAIPGDTIPHYNLNYTLNYLVRRGADKSKIIVDIPMYGQSYRLALPGKASLGDPVAGPGTAGEYTQQPGMLAYYEICRRIENDHWKLGPGPSAHNKDQFVSFDNPLSITYKGQYVLKNGFGGAAAWTVDLDDFTNRCCQEAFPLLRSINRALGRLVTPVPTKKNCKKPEEPVTPVAPIPTSDSSEQEALGWIPTSSSTTAWPWVPTTSTTTRKPSTPWWTGATSEACSVTGHQKADPTNCGVYYRCVLGQYRRELCSPGLHWDSKRKICNWPYSANCQSRVTDATAKPTVTTTTRRPAIIAVESENEVSEADECEHGQYYPHPNSCTHFQVCVNGVRVKQECGPGLHWNDAKNMCDWAYKNPCNRGAQINKRPNKIKQSEELEQQSCTAGSYSAVPGNCESYYACLWGKWEEFQCAPGLHYNPESNICDWPVRAKCEATEQPQQQPQPQPPGSPTTPKPAKPTTLPSAEIDPDKVSPLSGHFKIVCYFTNWAWYRRGVGRYLPENIDHTLCTHVVYGFAVLDYSNLVMKAHDSWADYDNHFYERVVAYKKRGVKVSIALGGWNDSAGDKYSRLVNNPAARRRFIEHAIQFIDKYGFDGLDLDWEYPVCWQTDCSKGPSQDKDAFTALVRELSEEFRPRNLLLSTAVSPNKKIVDAGYDVPELSRYFDWIAVMAYDYHGQWDKKTGHVAPMYYHPEDDVHYFNANYTINYWISKGAPPRSIVMGMPLYGQSFTLNDPKKSHDLNAPASAGTAGEFTKAAGFLAYYEICDRIKNKGWQVVLDPQRRMGPYAYKGNQWVGFDDPDMIRQKAQYVRDMGLGGGMVWALDLDDFRGRCGEGPHPLMNTLAQVLAEPPTEHDIPLPHPAVGEELQWEEPSEPPMSEAMKYPISVSKEDEYKVVCYFTNWAWYRQGKGKFLPEDIDPDLCSHIIYGFAVLDGDGLVIKTHDSWADIDNNFYERVVAHKKSGKKVLIAIGGWNDSAGDKYSRLANNPAARKRFIANVLQFIEKYGFDGLDLDWEYPVCWQVDCTKGPKSDKDGFSDLVRELSAEFKPRGLLLSSAVSPNKRVITEGYDVPVLSQYLDWIAVMTYDYHGQWDKKTGHNAPFYVRPDDWEPTFNANYSIHYWLERGAPPKKLVMGVPLYGQSFSLAERNVHGLNSPTYGGGEAGDDTRSRGFLSYYEICQRTKQGWTVVVDPERRIGPYAYNGDQWVSFDDAEQVRRKSEFIKELGLGGGMVWALDLDDFKNYCGCEPSPLLRTMNRVLRNYPPGPVCEVTSNYVLESESDIKPTPAPAPTTTTWPSYQPPATTVSTTTTDIPVEVAMEDEDTVEIEAGGPPPPGAPGSCDGKLFLPHKRDCRKYYLCNFGLLSELTCPNGLFWNIDHCDWPENTKCKKLPDSGSLVSTESPAPTSTSLAPGQWEEPKPTTTSTTTTTDKNFIVEENGEELSIGGRKMVCYFTNWAWYRPGAGKFLPEDIDSKLCTHVVYGFAVLDTERLVIRMHDSWADVDNDFYGRVTSLKKLGIKVLIGLGGWNDSAGDKYSRLVNNPEARKRFIQDILKFIEKYGFSGLDLDWEYPVCWQVECNRGPASDKQAFAAFVRELSAEFKPRNLLLSAAVSPSKKVIDAGYDVPVLSKYLDWIAVMTYDYHGQWDKKTGHNAPLYYYPGDDYDYFNANFSMRYWIEKGAQSRKLVMGVPFYGQTFTLAQSSTNGLNAPAPGPGQAGEFTRVGGFLAFYEICSKVKNNGWTVNRDPEGRIGPYATRGDQWVGYDDVSQVARKAEFIRELDLGGGMIWALDLDDFRGTCGCGKYPLLTALTSGLQGKIGQSQDCT